MLGSSDSISEANVVLNTAVADELKQFADLLENASDFEKELHALIKKVVTEHDRIIFNGNGYDDAWRFEAEQRGLLNLKSTPDALPYLLHQKNIDLFTSHKVYSEEELRARFEILSEKYSKIINIEALTMLDMVNKDILPAESRYIHELALTANAKRELDTLISCDYEEELVKELSKLASAVFAKKKELENDMIEANDCEDAAELARFSKDRIFARMTELRILVDELEIKTGASYWPYPSYGDILFSVK